jgi:hypothetical protein
VSITTTKDLKGNTWLFRSIHNRKYNFIIALRPKITNNFIVGSLSQEWCSPSYSKRLRQEDHLRTRSSRTA